MKQDKAKQVALDEKLVPSNDIVKIRNSNLIIDPSITQREETFQVVLDILKNTPSYNAFLISADVLEIYMQQRILDISPKVENQEFNKPPSSDTLREFLRELGYKGKLANNLKMYVDHMHQPWRTFAAIINRCLSGKILSNGRLHLQYQIDNRQTKVRRREIMRYPRFTKAIIHHFMSQHKSISKREGSPYHTIADDGLLERLMFINKGDLYQANWQKDTIAVVIQEPPSVLVKQAQKSSRKLKGIELLSDAAQFEIDTQKAIKASKHLVEGAGTLPEVPNESEDRSKPRDELDDWGSTDEEKYLLAYKDEKPEDIPWKSTNEDESDDDNDDEEEEDDKSIDIEKIDDEGTDTDDEDTVMGKVEKIVEQKADEEHEANEEQKGDENAGDEQVVVHVSTTQKERPILLQSTSSHLVSSNFGNQFINSPNVPLIGTIPENAEEEINSLLDVQIQQDVPNIQPKPYHPVKVLVIPERTQQQPSTPPAPLLLATEIPST
ncbi:hypothetical protein Tco_0742847 [Tanacetum coccineum]